MEKHTSEGLKGSWGDMEVVRARSKRGPGSSAPIKEELKVYEEFFKIAKGDKKQVRTLVLGGTPELRDLTIKHGSETVAIDVSPKLLLSLTNVMKYKYDDKNKFIVGDWLDMHKFFEPNSFDIILSDASVNNAPFKKWDILFKIIIKLLKEDGYFINRQIVYNIPCKLGAFEEMFNDFNEGKNTILGLVFELGFRSKLSKGVYNTKTKGFHWKPIAKQLNYLAKKYLNKTDFADFENMTKHAIYHTSIVTTEKEFNNILRKYFFIKKIGVIRNLILSDYVPIYLLKKKY